MAPGLANTPRTSCKLVNSAQIARLLRSRPSLMRVEYNTIGLHSSLGYRPPSPTVRRTQEPDHSRCKYGAPAPAFFLNPDAVVEVSITLLAPT